MPTEHDALVSSTAHGDLRTRQPSAPQRLTPPPTQHTAVIQRISKGRGGKVVTLVQSLYLSPDAYKALTRHLRPTCGSGGTSKDGVIERQGDHRESLAVGLQD
jgi:translation initiation factor 1